MLRSLRLADSYWFFGLIYFVEETHLDVFDKNGLKAIEFISR